MYSFKVKCNTRLPIDWVCCDLSGSKRHLMGGKRRSFWGEQLTHLHSVRLTETSHRRERVKWQNEEGCLPTFGHPQQRKPFFIAVTYSTVTCDSWDWNEKPSDRDEWSDYSDAFVQGGGWICATLPERFLPFIVLTLWSLSCKISQNWFDKNSLINLTYANPE